MHKACASISRRSDGERVTIQLFHESLFGQNEPLVGSWNHFSADFEMHDCHAQANMLALCL
ncbi:hypothetical protein [Halobacillus sp. A5]|uniref:hypothetical protein n=1 Tax=Halobacillus sp. A5 TaxID=2880263 RepID=UPI0020A6334D|nr:hypothetical protein [Halobacillus sp. A5]